MSLQTAILILTAIWLCIHGLHLVHRRNSSSLLPLSSSVTTGQRSLNSLSTNFTLSGLHLRISTTKFNPLHDRLASTLIRRGHKRTRQAFIKAYDLGVVAGALGMGIAVGYLFYMIFMLLWHQLEISIYHPELHISSSSILSKRDQRQLDPRGQLPGHSLKLTPIIPGITVPLSHLPSIIAAVFFSQLIHELGHAISGAVESLTILSCGASFTFCIPAAFVTFPTSATKSLHPRARSRVIAAGPFHNLLFALVIFLVARLAYLASFFSGYEDISNIGRVIVQVDVESPLRLHLVPGSIITKIDDTPLSSSTAEDLWITYLTSQPKTPELGWCTSTSTFKSPDICCGPSNESPLACFDLLEKSFEKVCINPVPLLAEAPLETRCSSNRNCGSDGSCVLPNTRTQLLRLRVRPPNGNGGEESVVLWSGTAEEVYEEVVVTKWRPRVWFLPRWLPLLVQTFWRYLLMATTSLFFFNLLPLPYLDGTELLKTFIELRLSNGLEASIYDLESLRGSSDDEGTREGRRWGERMVRFTNIGLSVCLVIYLVLAIVDVLH